MNEDHQKGMLCGLIAAGLRVEGLLRVALERPETREEIAPQIREAFELYSAIFRQTWPEAVPAETTVIESCVSEGADMSDPSDESDRSDTSETPDETDAFDVPEEDCEPVAVAEEEPEAVPEVVIVEAEPDAPASDTKPLADTLKVDELIARKETADLRRAFTLPGSLWLCASTTSSVSAARSLVAAMLVSAKCSTPSKASALTSRPSAILPAS